MTMEQCIECGRQFEKVHNNQKVCTQTCLRTRDKRIRRDKKRAARGTQLRPKCRQCGKEFDGAYGRKICSDECRDARKKAYRAGYYTPKPKRTNMGLVFEHPKTGDTWRLSQTGFTELVKQKEAPKVARTLAEAEEMAR